MLRYPYILFLAALCFVLLGLAACAPGGCGTTPEAFVSRTEDFFDDVRSLRLTAGDTGWEPYDDRLTELVETCYPQHEEQLSGKQRRRFWRRVSGYYVQRYGRAGARGMLQKLGLEPAGD